MKNLPPDSKVRALNVKQSNQPTSKLAYTLIVGEINYRLIPQPMTSKTNLIVSAQEPLDPNNWGCIFLSLDETSGFPVGHWWERWLPTEPKQGERGQGPETATCSSSLCRPSLERHDTEPRATKRKQRCSGDTKGFVRAGGGSGGGGGQRMGRGPGEHLIHSCGRAINLFKHPESLCLSGEKKRGDWLFYYNQPEAARIHSKVTIEPLLWRLAFDREKRQQKGPRPTSQTAMDIIIKSWLAKFLFWFYFFKHL